ncbi:hypothetical protein B0H19DRAFT_374793 [Mycena capillaripes]|nr:hypothetical protein B0H19DRAFT_374793 [Mycena capillaripes]
MDSACDTPGWSFSSSFIPVTAQTQHLLDLLRSNSSVPSKSSPLPTDITSVVLVADVTRCDTEIERLQAALDRITSERSVLQRYIERYRSLVSPIRRLPPELLAEIFGLCSPDRITFHELTTLATTIFPEGSDALDRISRSHLLRLAGVCSSWYQVVMGTPGLWATIEVAGSYDDITAFLSRSLEHSADCPLDLHLVPRHAAGLELLGQHSGRWREAEIYLTRHSLRLLSTLKDSFPLLERLAIGGRRTRLPDVFGTAPKLTDVTLALGDGQLPNLPWSQLRRITYDFGFHNEGDILNVLELMQRCPSGCVLSIHKLDLSKSDFSISGLPRVISNMWSLDLSTFHSRDSALTGQSLSDILGRLTLPCLRQLAFRSCLDQYLFWPRNQFTAFACRSSFRPTLTKLLLHDIIITVEELVECLSEMPALLELFIQDVPWAGDAEHVLITDDLFRQLTWTSDPACLTPHLSSLRVASFFTFNNHVLLNFLNSRIEPGRSHKGPFEMGLTQMDQPLTVDGAFARIVQLCAKWELRWSLD